MCGGTRWIEVPGYPGGGLSPRVRGNRVCQFGCPDLAGSIPACAGEPLASASITCKWTVYPRVCGGTARWGFGDPAYQGLSPRVRGNRPPSRRSSGWSGSIPACAGEPGVCRWALCVTAVYPRVCGGTFSINAATLADVGLSPRVRGNRVCPRMCRTLMRSIPACAGEPLTVVPNPS